MKNSDFLFPGIGFSSEDSKLEKLCLKAAQGLAESTLPVPEHAGTSGTGEPGGTRRTGPGEGSARQGSSGQTGPGRSKTGQGGSGQGQAAGQAAAGNRAENDRMLIEGVDYPGTWLESTGSISSETLARFLPRLARDTMRAFALHARKDGLLPYKILASGPAYRQIQMVSPLARAVRVLHALSPDAEFLGLMYEAMSANDAWLSRFRDTLKTGCVEAFCTFDTGHDLSPRFWLLPDTCYEEDPARFDPYSPLLPLIAPDLSANSVCQRKALSSIAKELGKPEEARHWSSLAEASESNLFARCFDPVDGFFYDRTASGTLHRIQSDVLLRVFSCGVGDDRLFKEACGRYLLNTRKFLSRCGLTSIAMDDPRFDGNASRNSWAGPVNLLSILRAPAAFEEHGRQVELVWILRSFLSSALRFEDFPQCLDPHSGDAGYGTGYTPAMLAVLDTVERMSGILPRPEGSFSCSALTALPSGSRQGKACATLASREVEGSIWSLLVEDRLATLSRDGIPQIRFPAGTRIEVSRDMVPLRITALVPGGISGRIESEGQSRAVCLEGNEVAAFMDGELCPLSSPGVIEPVW